MPGTERVEITGPYGDRYDEILTPQAIDLIAALHAELGPRRSELLAARRRRQAELSGGAMLDFLPETADIREDPDWQVAPPAPGLVDRRVEITGPTDKKMTINALNSGANVWLADFEDANTPLWDNMITGQLNLKDALDRTIDFTSADGKDYALRPDDELATIVVRPRGWHLDEKHILIDGAAGLRQPGRLRAVHGAPARSGSWTRARGRTSTWPRTRATSRRGCGTTPSTWPRTRSASRAARSGPRC